jgi:transcriptional regulator with XRE-family HTH domain
LPNGKPGTNLSGVSPKPNSWGAIAQKLRALVKHGEQKELASKLGITPAALSRYLNGERVPSDPVLALRLCSLLGVDLADVLGSGRGRTRSSAAFSVPLRRLAEGLAALSREANELAAKVEAGSDETEKGETSREHSSLRVPGHRTRKR